MGIVRARDDSCNNAQKIFNIAKAHTEAVIQPDGVADDLGGKAVSVVAWRVAFH